MCWWIIGVVLVDKIVLVDFFRCPSPASQVAAITATDKRQRISCGESLLLIVESEKRGGGKSFVGTTRFPSGRKGKQVDVRIGVFGKKVGQFTSKHMTPGVRSESGVGKKGGIQGMEEERASGVGGEAKRTNTATSGR